MGVLRVLALIGGAVLLLPGMCFLVWGGLQAGSDGGLQAGSDAGAAVSIGVILLLVAIGLFVLGFRLKTRMRDDSGGEGRRPED